MDVPLQVEIYNTIHKYNILKSGGWKLLEDKPHKQIKSKVLVNK
jgi:hypothetical protein